MMGTQPPVLSLNPNLSIQYNPAKGRYLTTSQDIATNTVVFSEPVYAGVSNYSDYCSGCFTRQKEAFTVRPYFCPTCLKGSETESVMFMYSALKGLQSFGILCFRIVNKVIREKGFDYDKWSKLVKGEGSMSEYKDDYCAVAGLKQSDMIVEDKSINLVLTALEKFNDNHPTDHNQSPERLRTMVQHVFSTLQYNVQGVRIVSMTDEGKFIEEKIGAGVYPTLALLNHSCNANTKIRFEQGNVVLTSTRLIRAGSEVTHNYGPTVEQLDREQRKVRLEQVYGFVCDCDSCLHEGAEGAHAMACGECTGPISFTFPTCSKCGVKSDPDDTIRNEQELIDQLTMIEFDWSEASVKCLVSHAEKVLFRESTFLGKVYDKMAKRYCEDSMWSKAEVYAAKSCDIIKAVYGENSVTYAIEWFKLCQIYFKKLRDDNNGGDKLKKSYMIDVRLIEVLEQRIDKCFGLFSEPSGVRADVVRELELMLDWYKKTQTSDSDSDSETELLKYGPLIDPEDYHLLK